MKHRANIAERVLEILTGFNEGVSELTVGTIAEQLGIHKSTASRLAATLVARGFLKRHDRSFQLGQEVERLGLRALGNRRLVPISLPLMELLARHTGETVHLVELHANQVRSLAHISGSSLVPASNFRGRTLKLHCCAGGKILLAFSEEAYIEEPLEAFTDRTITDVAKLRTELARVERNGWARNLGEFETGDNAVAVPIFDQKRCVGALGVSGPSDRLLPSLYPEVAALCRQAALAISQQLDARDDRSHSVWRRSAKTIT